MLQWLDEELGNEECSDLESIFESDHYSESEQSLDEFDDIEKFDLYVGKDGTQWSHRPLIQNRRIRRPQHNIVKHLPGVKGEAKNAKRPIDCLQLFFTDDILEEIVCCTNIYIATIRSKYSRERDAADTTITEIKACLGLLFLSGVLRTSHTNLLDLWAADGTGVEYFRLSMGINRFRFLLTCLRFDDIRNRAHRKETDKLAAIRFLIDQFNENCKKHYSLSELVTVDEMLDAFRGRCGFIQYIPSKPAKYGIKMFALTDARMFYTGHLEIYCGKQVAGPYLYDNTPHAIVKRMVKCISKSGRNVTCDNWFTSIPLAVDLLENDKLTMVGTIRKNKREIPPFMTVAKDRPVESSIFAFRKNMTLVSYKPKKDKVVLVLSTLHDDDSIDSDSEKCKPEIITFYNDTKSGVDKVDEMKCTYSVTRITRRWPFIIFSSLLNIAGINGYVIYKSNSDSTIPRKDYLKVLAKELLHDYMVMKVNLSSTPVNIKNRVKEILGLPTAEALPRAPQTTTRGRCNFCDRKKNRPTRFSCNVCNKFVCLEHVSAYLCSECSENSNHHE